MSTKSFKSPMVDEPRVFSSEMDLGPKVFSSPMPDPSDGLSDVWAIAVIDDSGTEYIILNEGTLSIPALDEFGADIDLLLIPAELPPAGRLPFLDENGDQDFIDLVQVLV